MNSSCGAEIQYCALYPSFSDCIQLTTQTAHLQPECLLVELSLCNLSDWCTEYIQLIDSNNASRQPQACSIEGGQVYGQCCSPAECVPLTHSRVQAVKETIEPAAQHRGRPGKHKAMHRSSRKPETKLYYHLDLSQWQCRQPSPMVNVPETTQEMMTNVDLWELWRILSLYCFLHNIIK